MSRLKDKLKKRQSRAAVQGEPEKVMPGSKNDVISQLRARMVRIENRREQRPFSSGDSAVSVVPVASVDPLPGARHNGPLGSVWVHALEKMDYVHGDAPLSLFLEAGDAISILAKDHRLAGLDPAKAVFVDTETTGLSGGAGTWAFLIGIGYFRAELFVVELLFCEDPGQEPAQLTRVAELLGSASFLVSFNGKSFDMPLLNSRFIINRIANPGYNKPHLDLLHISRRIFGRRLDDRSLQNLERVVLGFNRTGDIPGAEIPQVYRRWLDGLDTGDIARVLHHNALDILALPALAGVLGRMYNDPAAVAHAADHLGLAHAAINARQSTWADAHLDGAGIFNDMDAQVGALHMKAKMEMQNKAYARAAELWEQILGIDGEDAVAHLGLAKYYEHRKKDFEKALHHAHNTGALEGMTGQEKRCLRIERKMRRSGR